VGSSSGVGAQVMAALLRLHVCKWVCGHKEAKARRGELLACTGVQIRTRMLGAVLNFRFDERTL